MRHSARIAVLCESTVLSVMHSDSLQAEACASEDHTWVTFSLPRAYVDLLEAGKLRVPWVPLDRGVVLDGKLPHWMITGLALAYQQATWLAVYQPQAGGAVVVHSQIKDPAIALGDIWRPR